MKVWNVEVFGQPLYFVIFANTSEEAKEKILNRNKEVNFLHDLKEEELIVEEFTPDKYDGCLAFY